MAGEWILMRSGLESSLEVAQIACRFTLPVDAVVYRLYRLASWFDRFGKYGKMSTTTDVIDRYMDMPGFADLLAELGWMTFHENGVLSLRGFCNVSAKRKSIGQKTRKAILSSGVCAACGERAELEIDHNIPVSRGGSCEIENLQALCVGCNRRKGRKTMREFLG